MKLLRLEAAKPNGDPDSLVVTWVGTQADAARVRKELVADQGFKRTEVTTEEVDVPTQKAALLDWLNEQGV